ncbi:hypothetical protein H106_03990 [Trichophyton rubrum CBS 735.88]|nr:hypothetical protein H106_03990 [Trichophyton rubrum CBS 735.88]
MNKLKKTFSVCLLCLGLALCSLNQFQQCILPPPGADDDREPVPLLSSGADDMAVASFVKTRLGTVRCDFRGTRIARGVWDGRTRIASKEMARKGKKKYETRVTLESGWQTSNLQPPLALRRASSGASSY